VASSGLARGNGCERVEGADEGRHGTLGSQKWRSQRHERSLCHVIYSPDRNCIEFRIAPGGVGGTPTYRYRASTLQVIEEHSDVQ
jgi:hypothetical protein